MSPEQYCQQKAASSGSSFYYSFLFLPAEKRKAITALYAFCREVDDVVDETHDPGVAESKLNWWVEEIDALYKGNAKHPVSRALSASMEHFDLHREYLEEIIAGMQMDLHINRYNTFDELKLYCHRVAGVVGLLAVEIFGSSHRDTLKFAENLGTALQLTNIIRDVKEDAMRNRVYIPADELQKFSVQESDLQLPKTTTSLKKLLDFQMQRAQDYYRKALSSLPDCDRYNQVSSLVMAAIYQALLNEISKDDFQVMEHRIKLTPVRKLWIAWKTYRHEKKIHKK